MLAFLLQAIFAASQPDSDVPLTRKYVEEMKYDTLQTLMFSESSDGVFKFRYVGKTQLPLHFKKSHFLIIIKNTHQTIL